MIGRFLHWLRKRIERIKRDAAAVESYRGYERAMKLFYAGLSIQELEQEVEDRVFFARGAGHFEKGMLEFIDSTKAIDIITATRNEKDHDDE